MGIGQYDGLGSVVALILPLLCFYFSIHHGPEYGILIWKEKFSHQVYIYVIIHLPLNILIQLGRAALEFQLIAMTAGCSST